MVESIRVLFIDGEQSLLDVAKEKLRNEAGFAVQTALSAEEGLKLLGALHFDAVISDFEMPGMNGLELLKRIRTDQPEMPFILFTDGCQDHVLIEALNSGVDGYVARGADASAFAALTSIVRTAVERKKSARSSPQEAAEAPQARELAEITSRLSLAARAGAMGIWEWDIIRDRMTWDEQMFALYGRTAESFQCSYHAWMSCLEPKDAKECKEWVRAALRGDEEFDTEFRVVWPDSSVHHIRGIATVIRDASGAAVRMLGINWDITRQKQAEEALHTSEEEYRVLFDKMQEGFAYCRMLFDENDVPEDYVHLSVNSAFDDIIGARNVINRRVTEVFPGIREAMPELFAACGRVAITGKQESFDLNFSMIGKWLHLTVYSPAKEFFIALLVDITARKQAEAALAQSKTQFRQVFNDVNDGLQLNLMLPDGRPGICVECNEVACQMLGYSYEEMLRLSPSDYDTGKHEPSAEKSAEALCKNGQARYHTELRRQDGSMLPVDVNAHALSWEGRWLILSAIRDVTEGKKIEEALLQTNKNLNILTSITRHDTLNQTAVIQGYANLLEKTTLTPKQSEYVMKIDKSASAIQSQVEFTKHYQDIGAKAPKWQSVHETILKVKAALPLMTLIIRERKPDHSIHADPMFEKVAYNLIENCIRHSGGAKLMEITATEKEGELHLVFEDDGKGMTAADREHLFERGFGKNTGYGLFLSREILKISGISIEENSKEGKGARFEMVVPAGEWRVS